MGEITENRAGLRMLIAGSVLQLFLGIIYVWSVFVAPVSEAYGWEIGAVKLTASFMLSFFVIGILAGGKMQTIIGPSRMVLLGGIMLAAGMFATSITPITLPWMIYVTYGIIGGFGVGAGYNAIISTAQKSFPQRRGFATGVSVCAFGFSTVIFAPLVELLIGRFGLQQTFRILAGGFFLVVLLLFRFIRVPETATATAASAALLAKRQYTIKEILRTKEFYFITLSLMLATATFFVLNPSLKTLGAERSLSPALGTTLVMITGVANALGRLAVPLISDKLGRERAALLIILITGGAAILLCFAQGGAFMALVALAAFCYGGYSGIYPVITADYFGIKNVAANYGAVMVGFAISALAFPLIIGQISDMTTRFVVLAVLAFLGAVLVLLLIRAKKKSVS